jgi:hypothetical protein
MMSQNGPAALPGSPSTGLTAAALQDHLSRQLGLSLSEPLSSQRSHHSHSCVSKREGRVNAVSCRTRAVRGKHSWSGSRHVGRSGRREEERERVLDPMPPSLSLAQRMGLVERPTGHLTSGDWGQVKIVSRDRGDSSQPCPICQEEFGMKEQVLLSCSHVFHRLCLRSVERFSGKKKCPLCRHADYQTRLIYDGANQHRTRAAVVLQSWWRGVRVRRRYKEYRERVPPRDPSLRSKYYQRKLETLTTQMVETCTQSSSNADSVLAAADSALATARATMRILDHHSSLALTDWPTLRCRAIQNTSTAECPICISPILRDPSPAPPTSHAHHTQRPISLLSCGHLLHAACVSALEQYCTADASCGLPLCPFCRAPYHRQTLHL